MERQLVLGRQRVRSDMVVQYRVSPTELRMTKRGSRLGTEGLACRGRTRTCSHQIPFVVADGGLTSGGQQSLDAEAADARQTR